MASWLIVVIIAYVIAFATFIIMIFREAPKHGTVVGPMHLVVAALWPAWAIWYLFARISDWNERRKK